MSEVTPLLTPCAARTSPFAATESDHGRRCHIYAARIQLFAPIPYCLASGGHCPQDGAEVGGEGHLPATGGGRSERRADEARPDPAPGLNPVGKGPAIY